MKRKEWQEKIYRKNHNRILQTLRKKDGLTFKQLCIITKLSRPTVSNHLKALMKRESTVTRNESKWPRKYYLNEKLMRLQKITNILRLQEEHNREVQREVEIARMVGGDKGTKMLDNILEQEYIRAIFVQEKIIEKGGEAAKKAEKRLKAIRTLILK